MVIKASTNIKKFSDRILKCSGKDRFYNIFGFVNNKFKDKLYSFFFISYFFQTFILAS